MGNPANRTGKIKNIEIYGDDVVNLLGVTVATFYRKEENNFYTRDYEYIGDVAPGKKRIFEVDIDVSSGDYIGVVAKSSSLIQTDISGGDNIMYKHGEYIPCENENFNVQTGWVISLYGKGKTIL
ncbi:hypothetical protein ES708_35236 [subsurface metagenome]